MNKRERIRQLEASLARHAEELSERTEDLERMTSARTDALDRIGTLIDTRDRVIAERDAARDLAASMGQGILAIHGERLTHTSEHDYDADNDDVYSYHQLAAAAAVYAAPEEIFDLRQEPEEHHRTLTFENIWPSNDTAPKITRPIPDLRGGQAEARVVALVRRQREARIHELAKAGSLIAAEIERIIRLGGGERHEVYKQGPVPVEDPSPIGKPAYEICGAFEPGSSRLCFRVRGHEGAHTWEVEPSPHGVEEGE